MKGWRAVFLVVALLFGAVWFSHNANADVVPSWFDGSSLPSIELLEQGAKLRKVTYWGVDCVDQQVQAISFDSNGTRVSRQVNECVHQAPYGTVGTFGIKLNGTATAYEVRSTTGAKTALYPIPESKDMLGFSQTGNSLYKYVHLYKNLTQNITTQNNTSGQLQYYKLTQPSITTSDTVLLTDGTKARVQDQSLVYAQDGKHILANAGGGQTLIDTVNLTARLVGQNTIPSSGSPDVTSGVSTNADTMFVADNNTGKYVLYNTSNCTPAIGTGKPEICESRDVSSFIKSHVGNIRRMGQVRFLSDEKIELLIAVTIAGGARLDRYVLTIPNYLAPDFDYLALGDSFASGEGAYSYYENTNTDTNRCHISENAYPYLLVNELGFTKGESVACSGGKIKDVKQEDEKYSKRSPQATGKDDAQYDEEIFTGFLPGYRRQREFVQKYQPDATTVSIVGNDISFGKKLQYCILTQYSCYESAAQKQNILKEIKGQFPGLVAVYEDLKVASPNTRIYAVGYPRLVLPGGNCALNVHLSEAELVLADEIVEDLNIMIKRAAQKAGVFYIDTLNTFSGHRLCEDKSWNLAVNGLTLGTDQPYNIGPISSATFHPNKLGHQLFASTILAKTNNLTEPMPPADNSINVTDMPSRLSPTGDTTGTGKQPILEDGLFGEFIKVGESLTSLISTAGYYLRTGETFMVELHSAPTVVGTATVVNPETLNVEASIPDTIEPGAHEIHIYGTNIIGEPIDIYKNVLVVASAEDYDGDGVANTVDPCTFVVASGVDSDADGIDDACDPLISEAATPSEPEPNTTGDNSPPVITPVAPPDIGLGDGLIGRFVTDVVSTVLTQLGVTAGRQSEPTAKDNGEQTTVSTSPKLITNNKPPGKSPKVNNPINPLLLFLTSTPLGFLVVILIDLL